jgi:Zn-dependent protease with chaperone function
MDFFGYQQQARRYSVLLLVLFALAVVALVLAVNLVLAWGVLLLDWRHGGYRQLADLPPVFHAWVSGITVLLVGLTTLRRLWQLGAGGPVVARLAGARWVPPDVSDLPRRRLLNVAEELAVASGHAMPRIYLMEDEPGINAFAAGRGPADAVVAVTRGCLERLDREQLQGVLAHEFSHLLHGDGRLNIHLLGLLHGITAPGALGLWLLRSATPSWGTRGRLRRRGLPGQIPLGALLALVGYGGVLLARLIRAAMSRQREFLADAAAVQFTRNPRGLAGALRCVRDDADGARLRTAQAEALSHMLFVSRGGGWLRRLLASHPPLDVRIARIYPLYQRRVARPVAPEAKPEPPADAAPASAAATANALAGQVGEIDAAGLGYAAELLAAVPSSLREATQTAGGASALLFGLLAAGGAAAVHGRMDPQEAAHVAHLGAAARRLGPRFRLPLIDLALPALLALSPAQRRRLLDDLHELAGTRSAQWAVLALLRHHLAPPARRAAGGGSQADAARQVLATLAECADTGGEAAYRAACAQLELPAQAVKAERAAFEDALGHFAKAPLAQRLRLLAAGALAVSHDGVIEVDELETLRVIGAALDCPLPPLGGRPA